jgi:hypothetical protein
MKIKGPHSHTFLSHLMRTWIRHHRTSLKLRVRSAGMLHSILQLNAPPVIAPSKPYHTPEDVIVVQFELSASAMDRIYEMV